MEFIEATWEKRNLGVTCVEIEIGRNDKCRDIIDRINTRAEEYQVVKLPVGRVDCLLELQKEGFTFIETVFQTEIRFVKEPEIPPKYKKLVEKISSRVATKTEIEELIQKVEAGEIFSTDRIAVDPYFGVKVAGKRYAFWMRDLMDSGKAILGVSEYEGIKMGWEIDLLDTKGKVSNSVLGGMYPETLGSGFGAIGMYYTILGSYHAGSKKMVSHVSSNNPEILKVHLNAGMKIKKMEYVLIKHTC